MHQAFSYHRLQPIAECKSHIAYVLIAQFPIISLVNLFTTEIGRRKQHQIETQNQRYTQMIITRQIVIITTVVLFPALAHAYVGPGAGLSAIGTILAFIGSLLLLVVGFIWYPLKRVFGKKTAVHETTGEEKAAVAMQHTSNNEISGTRI